MGNNGVTRELTMAEALRILGRGKRLIFAVVFVSLVVAYGMTVRQKSVYTSSCKMLIGDQTSTQHYSSQGGGILSGLVAAPSAKGVDFGVIASSRRITDKVFSDPKLIEEYKKFESPETFSDPKQKRFFLDTQQSALKVGLGGNGTMLTLTMEAPSRKLAAEVVNTYARELVLFVENQFQSDFKRKRIYTGLRMRGALRTLREAEAARRDFETNHRVYNVDMEFDDEVKRLTELRGVLMTKEIARDTLKTRVDRFRKEYGGQDEKLSLLALEDAAVVKLRSDLVDNELEAAQRGLLFNVSEDPVLQNMRDQSRQTRERLAQELKRMTDSEMTDDEIQLFMLDCEIEGYNKAIGSIENRVRRYPDERVEYYRIMREVDIEEALYKMLRDEYEKARIEEARSPIILRMLDKGLEPPFRTRPRLKVTLAVTFFVSLFVGAYLVFFAEYIRRVRESSEA